MISFAVLTALWVLWCTVHSLLISPWVTLFMKSRLEDGFKYYRLGYNSFSLLSLLSISVYGKSLESVMVFAWEGPAVILQVFLLISSLFFFIAGAAKYDMRQFLGIAQIQSGHSNTVLTESGRLDTGGILQVTRHPWYLGALFILWSYQVEIDLQSFLANLVLSFYLVIGTLLEERKLISQFGDEYKRYSREVSMLFPYKWLRTRVRIRS